MSLDQQGSSSFPSGGSCNHAWQPYADAVRIWQVCVKCGTEQHVTTHEAHLADTLAYIFRDSE